MQNIDDISKQRAKELFGSADSSSFEVGTTKGLQQIHRYFLIIYTTLPERSA